MELTVLLGKSTPGFRRELWAQLVHSVNQVKFAIGNSVNPHQPYCGTVEILYLTAALGAALLPFHFARYKR